MHHPTDRIIHTTAFVTPVVEHWLERENSWTGCTFEGRLLSRLPLAVGLVVVPSDQEPSWRAVRDPSSRTLAASSWARASGGWRAPAWRPSASPACVSPYPEPLRSEPHHSQQMSQCPFCPGTHSWGFCARFLVHSLQGFYQRISCQPCLTTGEFQRFL